MVNGGVVTLTGEVSQGKWAAEDITKRVSGVRAIANDIRVTIPLSGVRTDTDIAVAAANALQWNVSMGGGSGGCQRRKSSIDPIATMSMLPPDGISVGSSHSRVGDLGINARRILWALCFPKSQR